MISSFHVENPNYVAHVRSYIDKIGDEEHIYKLGELLLPLPIGFGMEPPLGLSMCYSPPLCGCGPHPNLTLYQSPLLCDLGLLEIVLGHCLQLDEDSFLN